MKILLFGFGSFPGVEVNHTSDLVLEINSEEAIAGLIIRSCVLPVDFQTVNNIIEKEIIGFNPDYSVLTGIKPGAEIIYLEKVALNVISSKIADNSGNYANGEKILQGGREAFFSSIDLNFIKQKLYANKIDSEISYFAGTYLCNQSYYISCALMNKLKGKPDSMFVHLPSAEVGSDNYVIQYLAVKSVILGLQEI